ncbi:MAG TPA: hypothetical protein RMG48_07050 [Myxococcales bacterium LLY-WYZ-16_1]|nr:hypothetical protein [Myxococcales bacterium LLY-WYZ-16_1]
MGMMASLRGASTAEVGGTSPWPAREGEAGWAVFRPIWVLVFVAAPGRAPRCFFRVDVFRLVVAFFVAAFLVAAFLVAAFFVAAFFVAAFRVAVDFFAAAFLRFVAAFFVVACRVAVDFFAAVFLRFAAAFGVAAFVRFRLLLREGLRRLVLIVSSPIGAP